MKGVVLVEDVSLCFEGLGGLPGPYIKWFLKSLPNEKIYAMLKGSENYKATAECRFALASPNMEP